MKKSTRESERIRLVRQLWLDLYPERKGTDHHVLLFYGWLEQKHPELLSRKHGDPYQQLNLHGRALHRQQNESDERYARDAIRLETIRRWPDRIAGIVARASSILGLAARGRADEIFFSCTVQLRRDFPGACIRQSLTQERRVS